jgi:hypothetical protein
MRHGVTIATGLAFKTLFLLNNTIFNAGSGMTFWANGF